MSASEPAAPAPENMAVGNIREPDNMRGILEMMSCPADRDQSGLNDVYVAYGSNLCPRRMRKRCADAHPLGMGELVGWRLKFAGGREGVLGIEPENGSTVPVACYEVSDADLKALDKCEGVRVEDDRQTGKYHKVFWTQEGRRYVAYIMNEERLAKAAPPTEKYRKFCENGVDSWGLNPAALMRALKEAKAAAASGGGGGEGR